MIPSYPSKTFEKNDVNRGLPKMQSTIKNNNMSVETHLIKKGKPTKKK